MRRGTWSRVFGRGVDFLQKRKGLSISDPRHDPRADQSCYKKWGLPGARARVKSAKVPYVYCTRTTALPPVATVLLYDENRNV